jgi:hypothetical protein
MGVVADRHPAPAAWVVRTALNVNISWWRRRRREVLVADPGRIAHLPTVEGEAIGSVDPRMMTALLRLPIRQRQVVALRLFLDLDTGRTAEVLGVAPGSVQAHLGRALAALAAWTVTKQADGDVRVTIRELLNPDPAGLQAALRADGVPAAVRIGWDSGWPPPVSRGPVPAEADRADASWGPEAWRRANHRPVGDPARCWPRHHHYPPVRGNGFLGVGGGVSLVKASTQCTGS